MYGKFSLQIMCTVPIRIHHFSHVVLYYLITFLHQHCECCEICNIINLLYLEREQVTKTFRDEIKILIKKRAAESKSYLGTHIPVGGRVKSKNILNINST